MKTSLKTVGSSIRNLLLTLAMLAVGLVGFGTAAKAECLTLIDTRISIFDSGGKTNKIAKAMVLDNFESSSWNLWVWIDSGYNWDVHMYTMYQAQNGTWYPVPNQDVWRSYVKTASMSMTYSKCMNVCPLQIITYIEVFDPFTGELVSWNFARVRQPAPPPPAL